MQRSDYKHLCSEAQAGNDAFVLNLSNNEEGLVTTCIKKTEHIVVKTAGGAIRCWNFRECKEVQYRNSVPMI